MENNEEIKKEDKRALKEALVKLIDEEPKKLSQEEAINNYAEKSTKKKLADGSDSESDESNQEETEHLKRIKAELLSSLKRVEDLSKKIFVNKEFKNKNIVKNADGLSGISKNIQKDKIMEVTKNHNMEDNKALKQRNQNEDKTIE